PSSPSPTTDTWVAPSRACELTEGPKRMWGISAPTVDLLVAVGDAAAAEVVGGQLDLDPVAREDADAVLAHLAAEVTEHLVAVVERDAEMPALQCLLGDSLD